MLGAAVVGFLVVATGCWVELAGRGVSFSLEVVTGVEDGLLDARVGVAVAEPFLLPSLSLSLWMLPSPPR